MPCRTWPGLGNIEHESFLLVDFQGDSLLRVELRLPFALGPHLPRVHNTGVEWGTCNPPQQATYDAPSLFVTDMTQIYMKLSAVGQTSFS